MGDFRGTSDFDPSSGQVEFTTEDNRYDVYVVSYAPDGQLRWAQQFGSASESEYGYALAINDAGEIHITGRLRSAPMTIGNTTLTPQGAGDAFLAKLDADGNAIWATSWGGGTWATPSSLAVAPSGDVIVGGYFYGTTDFDPGVGQASYDSPDQYDGYVSRFDADGNFQSVKVLTGPESDYVRSVAVDDVGNMFVAAQFNSTASFDGQPVTSGGEDDTFLAKLNSADQLQWIRQASSAESIQVPTVAVDAAGDVVFASGYEGTASLSGTSQSHVSIGGRDGLISKWTTDGNLLWSGSIGGAEEVSIRSLAPHADGRLVLRGTQQRIPTAFSLSRIRLKIHRLRSRFSRQAASMQPCWISTAWRNCKRGRREHG